MSTIKVGYLISYDYEFIKTSLPIVYNFVDEIYFAIDKDRVTWSGESFEISDEFWHWIAEFDSDNKITLYEDRFHIEGLTSMECDTRERNMLAAKMGSSDWYLQIDADEYFIDFEDFVYRLRSHTPKFPCSIYCRVATLFKEVNDGFLVIGESFETLSFATNHPVYDVARNNTSGNKHIHWNDLVLHQSWARNPDEINQKLNNWSHKDDFNTDSFYNLWQAVDENNYYCLNNFHPINPHLWPKLDLIRGDIPEILDSAVRTSSIAITKKKPILSRLWREIKAK